MNRAAKRWGYTEAVPPAVVEVVAGAAPKTGTDSNHGNAIVTPIPRRNARRVKSGRSTGRKGFWLSLMGRLFGSHVDVGALGEKLRARHQGFDQGTEAMAI